MPEPTQEEPLRADETALGWVVSRVRRRLHRSPRLAHDTFWTFTSNALNVVAGLALFKAISLLVPPQEYGTASLALGIVALLSQFIAGPLLQAQFRQYFRFATDGRIRPFVGAAGGLLLRAGVIMTLGYLAIAFAYLQAGNRMLWGLALPAIALLFLGNLVTGTFGLLEAQRRYRGLALVQSLHKVLHVLFFAVLAGLVAGTADMLLWAQVAAALAILVFWLMRDKPLASSDAEPLEGLGQAAARSFGWSLYAMTICSWVLTISDRYLIEYFLGVKEVGLYAMNYGLWSMPYLILNGWLEMLVRTRMYERAEKNEWPSVRQLVNQRLISALLLGSLGTAIIYWYGRGIAIRVISAEYWGGQTLMVLISAAHLLFVVAMSYHSFFIAAERTRPMAWSMAAACLLNVALNLWLVPKMGIVGAGWSTLAGYALLLILFAGNARRILIQRETAIAPQHQ